MNLSKYKKIFNFKLASIGAILMGSMVFLSQLENGVYPASTAATKQFFYTFIVSSILIAIVETIVTAKQNSLHPAFYGVMAAWAFTTIMSSVLHLLKGTHDPLNAILINIILAPPGLIFVAFRKKRALKKEAKFLN